MGLVVIRRSRVLFVSIVAVSPVVVACPSSPPKAPDAAPATTGSTPSQFEVSETIYDGGLKNSWQASGSAPRESPTNGPAKVRFSDNGEWIFTKPGLTGEYDGVIFHMKAPAGEGEFLEVGVKSGDAGTTHLIKISPDHRRDLGDGWAEVLIPMDQLDPNRSAFDRVVLRAFRPYGTDWVLVDKVGLTKRTARTPHASAIANGKPAPMRIACEAKATKISPLIFGVAGADASHTPADIGTIHRWGGNRTSRYNWERHVDNSARDWFFENHVSPNYAEFLTDNTAHGKSSALTVPILGWVAKDATSYSFPVSVFGAQGKSDPYRTDAGDGTTPSGANIPPGPPTRSSVAAPPDWVKRWVLTIRANDAKTGKHSVREYILDNEPMLWNATHRDVRPEPLGYDELLERTIQYGSAIREADPEALIAGPAEWGWTNYFTSAKDTAPGVHLKADRRAHDDLPLVEWYLRKLREHERKTGTRVLDVFDLHYYPQANGVFSDAADPRTAALRLRSTRSLWDPSYTDESWINDTVRLLPRMKEWVLNNYPGRGISIGEWNFGGEKHVTGALATAEALGRFAQFGVTSAFYWTVPPAGSPTIQGFLAYRNFDGKGGRFLDWSIPTATSQGASLFASRDEEGKHLVAVAINMSPDDALLLRLDLSTCGAIVSHQAHVYTEGATRFIPSDRVQGAVTAFDEPLPPWSITVLEIQLAQPLPKNME
jgi:hypothetical protein